MSCMAPVCMQHVFKHIELSHGSRVLQQDANPVLLADTRSTSYQLVNGTGTCNRKYASQPQPQQSATSHASCQTQAMLTMHLLVHMVVDILALIRRQMRVKICSCSVSANRYSVHINAPILQSPYKLEAATGNPTAACDGAGCAMILSAATAGHSTKFVSRSDSVRSLWERRPYDTEADTVVPTCQLTPYSS